MYTFFYYKMNNSHEKHKVNRYNLSGLDNVIFMISSLDNYPTCLS